jgi:hypothetical protein
VKRLKSLFFLLAALLPAFCAAAVTADQARTMPLPVLAHRLLGEAGAIMIDVDRPHSSNLTFEPIKFYSHAIVPGSQFGLCAADRVTVTFDEKQNIESLTSDRRYGVAGNVYRPAEKWTYDDFGKLCASVKSTREYFPAPDPQTALDVALYADALAGNGPFASQNFSYSCTGRCAQGRDDLKWLQLNKIDSVRLLDCPKPEKGAVCVEITVGSHEVGPFPKVFNIYGTAWYKSVVISKVVVWVGSTLE